MRETPRPLRRAFHSEIISHDKRHAAYFFILEPWWSILRTLYIPQAFTYQPIPLFLIKRKQDNTRTHHHQKCIQHSHQQHFSSQP